MCAFKASKLGVLVATDDSGVVTRLYREALSLFETSVEHLGRVDFSYVLLKGRARTFQARRIGGKFKSELYFKSRYDMAIIPRLN